MMNVRPVVAKYLSTSASVKPCVGILGVRADKHGSFMRGPAMAPPLIRKSIKCQSLNSYSELATNNKDSYRDFGDISEGDYNSTEEMHRNIEAAMENIMKANLVPIVFGGDHHISNPLVKSVARYHGRPISIVQFDAHNDLYENFDGNPYSHASPFARILEHTPQACSKLVQVGIRTATDHNREQAKKYNVSLIEMKDMPQDGKSIAGILNALLPADNPVYISFDLDALDPAYAPAVSHWEPGGMTTRSALDAILHLRRVIVGADIVEYNPLREINEGMTAMVAAKLFREITAKIIVQKSGSV